VSAEPTTAQGPLADPVAEATRLIDAATERGLTARALGGTAIYLQSPGRQPLLPRAMKDIDLVVRRDEGAALIELLAQLGYVGDEMFNALRGSRRQLHRDPVNGRDLDVFVEEFSLCHTLPIAARLTREPYTLPLAELLLTKLQIVELNERDERDVYSLVYHHEVSSDGGTGIEADVIAELCAADWGLWRTCKGTIERCVADVGGYGLDATASATIAERLARIWERVEAEPKSGKWKRRSRLGERKRWYDEPEED
jgi:hypothetical protein